jgi:CDP-diacylglycerol--glycerol-3-phosphate 3-phosphatidyltransferase
VNVPNLLAGLRVPLLFIVAYVVMYEPSGWRAVAATLVILAGVTDIADGIVARKLNQVSDFGAYLDLTVDKVFVCPLLFLVGLIGGEMDPLLIWIAIVVTMREFLLMGLRTYAASRSLVIPAFPLGKAKTATLFTGLVMVILDVGFVRFEPLPLGHWVLLAGAVIALVSGVDYVVRANKVLGAPTPSAPE